MSCTAPAAAANTITRLPLVSSQSVTKIGGHSGALLQFVNSFHLTTPPSSQGPLFSGAEPPSGLPVSPLPNPSPTLGVVLEKYRQRKLQLQQQQQQLQEHQQRLKEESGDESKSNQNSPGRPVPVPHAATSMAPPDVVASVPVLHRQVTLPPANSDTLQSTNNHSERKELLDELAKMAPPCRQSPVPVAIKGEVEQDTKSRSPSSTAAYNTSCTPPEVREEFEALFGKKPSPVTADATAMGNGGTIIALVTSGRKGIGAKEKHPKALLGGLGACAALKRAREDDGDGAAEDDEKGQKARGRKGGKKPEVECTPAEYWEIQ
eukprot:GILI01024235.1.p1 GENE.GILI01024235.1~~GILI01024235.1.p1  ORF type:complete len:351 (-),score=71.46 GILI01024235.1:69-1028(-)